MIPAVGDVMPASLADGLRKLLIPFFAVKFSAAVKLDK